MPSCPARSRRLLPGRRGELPPVRVPFDDSLAQRSPLAETQGEHAGVKRARDREGDRRSRSRLVGREVFRAAGGLTSCTKACGFKCTWSRGRAGAPRPLCGRSHEPDVQEAAHHSDTWRASLSARAMERGEILTLGANLCAPWRQLAICSSEGSGGSLCTTRTVLRTPKNCWSSRSKGEGADDAPRHRTSSPSPQARAAAMESGGSPHFSPRSLCPRARESGRSLTDKVRAAHQMGSHSSP